MEIVGVGKEESSADLSGGSGMILSTQELQDCKKNQLNTGDSQSLLFFSCGKYEF